MAESAESLDLEPTQLGPLPIAEFSRQNQPVPVATFRHVASGDYRVMKERASRSYPVIAKKSSALLTHLKRRIHTNSEEYPLRIVAVAGGTAFILGIILRVWRHQT